jgi:hypothetical protein
MIDNYLTFPDRRPPAGRGKKDIDKILAEYDQNLPFFHKGKHMRSNHKLKDKLEARLQVLAIELAQIFF